MKRRHKIKKIMYKLVDKLPSKIKPVMPQRINYFEGLNCTIARKEFHIEFEGNGLKLLFTEEDERSVSIMIKNILYEREYEFFNNSQDFYMIDIGMNYAITSLCMAQKNNCKAIYAFEPFASTYQVAQRNIEANPELKSKFSIHNFGFGATEEELTLKYNPSLAACMSTVRPAYTEECYGNIQSAVIKVKKASDILPPLIKNHKEQLFLKIDCEGAEYDILPDLSASGILNHTSIAILEWHFEKPDKLIKIFQDNGFICFVDSQNLDMTQGMIKAVNVERYKNG